MTTRAGDRSDGTTVWATPAWRERATAWADDELAAQGVRRTGAVEQPHLRPWSTVLRLPTSAGSVWLKAPGPGLASEVGLYPVLARWAPEHVLVPYAVDAERRWLLLPDGGEVLGRRLTPEAADRWHLALAGYARLQQRVSRAADLLVAAGAPDHRPQRLTALLEEVADDAAAVTVTDEEREVVARARRERGRVEELAGVLADDGTPPTVQHDDLHRDNVFAHGPRVFDWGDAVVAHPYASLLVALRDTAAPYGVGLEDPRVLAARDAYLAPYGGPTAATLRVVEAARTVGILSRTASWLRALAPLPPHEAADVREAPYRWLAMLADGESL
ncbi:phosphotransferase [Lapillicoccus jejuensis]|uniref:Phosphotransferase family enzyme n=1 Tax=Lapillicoccus jejuensis TaxID=402171 RepID=A0A542DVI7_9MICO|nr:phosphotransferase [Lapillicoccus jejuensis]TQJ07109.1 phosphotransferase family enzyme [Lapillicoccus jejuensis]